MYAALWWSWTQRLAFQRFAFFRRSLTIALPIETAFISTPAHKCSSRDPRRRQMGPTLVHYHNGHIDVLIKVHVNSCTPFQWKTAPRCSCSAAATTTVCLSSWLAMAAKIVHTATMNWPVMLVSVPTNSPQNGPIGSPIFSISAQDFFLRLIFSSYSPLIFLIVIVFLAVLGLFLWHYWPRDCCKKRKHRCAGMENLISVDDVVLFSYTDYLADIGRQNGFLPHEIARNGSRTTSMSVRK